MSKAFEINFDGLIGPTHNFSGLAFGNIASLSNKYAVSHPKKAALQGLGKMRLLHSLGVKQGFIPPQVRPDLTVLLKKGMKGSDREILKESSEKDFAGLLEASSASSMWVANSATVSPSVDTKDKKLHLTPANLASQTHRAMEAEQTAKVLKLIFPESDGFVHHPVLKNTLFDEGAANHLRLSGSHGEKGLEIFVYGKNGSSKLAPKLFPARQSLKASQKNAKAHSLENVLFVQQNPEVIDKGVFHNDVISVSNENVLLYHEKAFGGGAKTIKGIENTFAKVSDEKLYLIEIRQEDLIVEGAVMSYLFNSQIVTLPNGKMAVIAPEECKESKILAIIKKIIADENPVEEAHFVELNESMANGGGPACLRLRVVLTEDELSKINQNFILDNEKFSKLEEWINKNYRDELHMGDLGDYAFFKHCRQALDEFVKVMELGEIYD